MGHSLGFVYLFAALLAVQISFVSPVDLSSISLTFQGGFVGRSVSLSVTTLTSPKKFVPLHCWEPRDCNDAQVFPVCPVEPQSACSVSNLKLTFPQSTDFYGRITLYALDIQGRISSSAATDGAATTPSDSPAAASP